MRFSDGLDEYENEYQLSEKWLDKGVQYDYSWPLKDGDLRCLPSMAPSAYTCPKTRR